MNYQNHVIDPTYFWDAIEEFSFDYKIYIEQQDEVNVDDYGRRIITYKEDIIRRSLQSTGLNLKQSKDGNTQERTYNFYCKSIYRINIGDIIEYKNQYLRCDSLSDDYDEFGVRGAKLTQISLTQYRDFADYVKYLRGEKLV